MRSFYKTRAPRSPPRSLRRRCAQCRRTRHQASALGGLDLRCPYLSRYEPDPPATEPPGTAAPDFDPVGPAAMVLCPTVTCHAWPGRNPPRARHTGPRPRCLRPHWGRRATRRLLLIRKGQGQGQTPQYERQLGTQPTTQRKTRGGPSRKISNPMEHQAGVLSTCRRPRAPRNWSQSPLTPFPLVWRSI